MATTLQRSPLTPPQHHRSLPLYAPHVDATWAPHHLRLGLVVKPASGGEWNLGVERTDWKDVFRASVPLLLDSATKCNPNLKHRLNLCFRAP